MLEGLQTHKVLRVLTERFIPYLNRDINELIINREKEIWLARGSDYERVEAEEFDKENLLRFCEQLATYRNLFFNSEVPHLACSIPFTRYRVNALHPSITTTNQLALCIRVPSDSKFELEEFEMGEHCKYSYEDIKQMVIDGSNILVSGGTASGKTSFLNALIEHIPLKNRILSVEDSPELDLRRFPNCVQILVGKNEDTNFTYEQALNNAMRMSPERLMLGEIDTRNAMLFLRFGNTGHRGMVSTLHANSVNSVIEAIALNIKISKGSNLELETVEQYFKSAIDVVIQINKVGNKRVIQEIKKTEEITI